MLFRQNCEYCSYCHLCKLQETYDNRALAVWLEPALRAVGKRFQRLSNCRSEVNSAVSGTHHYLPVFLWGSLRPVHLEVRVADVLLGFRSGKVALLLTLAFDCRYANPTTNLSSLTEVLRVTDKAVGVTVLVAISRLDV